MQAREEMKLLERKLCRKVDDDADVVGGGKSVYLRDDILFEALLPLPLQKYTLMIAWKIHSHTNTENIFSISCIASNAPSSAPNSNLENGFLQLFCYLASFSALFVVPYLYLKESEVTPIFLREKPSVWKWLRACVCVCEKDRDRERERESESLPHSPKHFTLVKLFNLKMRNVFIRSDCTSVGVHACWVTCFNYTSSSSSSISTYLQRLYIVLTQNLCIQVQALSCYIYQKNHMSV